MYCMLYAHRRKRKHKRWANRTCLVRDINRNRDEQGHFNHLFQELKKDPVMFFRYTRMTVDVFYMLLNMVKPLIKKRNWRALPAELRLAVTLRFIIFI